MSEDDRQGLASAEALAHPLALAQALIRCESVTPADGGALDVLQGALETLGFTCHRLPFEEPGTATVDNLYARRGEGGPNFCFAGHTDVVPTGDPAGWTREPFAAQVEDGVLYGRGASDMKGAIAAFVAAVARFGAGGTGAGSISLLITGDEEGPAVNGTRKVLDWLAARGESARCLPRGRADQPGRAGRDGEDRPARQPQRHAPGRRPPGARRLSGACRQPAAPARRAAECPAHPQAGRGDRPFPAEPPGADLDRRGQRRRRTSFPASAAARFNVRFNDRHTGASLERTIRACLDAVNEPYELATEVSGEAFLTPPGPLSTIIADSVAAVTGRTPVLSTTGGTSDARFIKDHCPVAEFGLLSRTMHRTDECVPVEALERLADIYLGILERYFAGS